MLQKGRDEDGISLSDKVFVFGNKLDMAGNSQLAKDNVSALVHDAAEQYEIAMNDRIICGSAKSYLEKAGILSQDDKNRGLRNISDTLEKWQMSDGIEELKAKMQHYYENDRFAVLQKRAEKNINDTVNFLTSILAKYNAESDSDADDGGKYFLQAKDALDSFSTRAVEIGRNYKQKIVDESPFSSLLRDNIEEIYPTVAENSLAVINAENLIAGGEGYSLSRIDALMRENLYFEFQKNIITKTAGATLREETEIYQALSEEFLKSLNLKEDSTYHSKLYESVQMLFKSLLIENGEHCYFNSFIERYATGLIEALIKTPLASAERLKKVTDAKTLPDFQSLAVYYSQPLNISESSGSEENDSEEFVEENILSVEDRQKYFFAKIISHEEFEPPTVEDNENVLRQFFDEYNANLAAGFEVDKLPFTSWAILLKKLGIKVSESDLLPRLKNALIKFVNVAAWSKMSGKDKNRQLENAILDYCVKVTSKSLIEYLSELSRQTKGVENKVEMISVINTDIEILRDFTLNSVVIAMGLERAFNSVMSKNIELIRESIETPKGQQIFNDWLKSNMRKIYANEYAEIDKNIDAFKDKKAVAEAIQQVLKKLNK